MPQSVSSTQCLKATCQTKATTAGAFVAGALTCQPDVPPLLHAPTVPRAWFLSLEHMLTMASFFFSRVGLASCSGNTGGATTAATATKLPVKTTAATATTAAPTKANSNCTATCTQNADCKDNQWCNPNNAANADRCVTCAAGKYVERTPDGKSGTCKPCSNKKCDSGKYRSGTCANSVNGCVSTLLCVREPSRIQFARSC